VSILDCYLLQGFGLAGVNGTYRPMAGTNMFGTVFTNGSYYMRYGGPGYPRWIIQQSLGATVVIYQTAEGSSPYNDGGRWEEVPPNAIPPGGYADSCPETGDSASSVSSELSSSSSSASTMPKYAVYVSHCRTMRDITHPSVGAEVGMTFVGHLDEVALPQPSAYRRGYSLHVEKGGLKRTVANGGALVCRDASKLFESSARGMVTMRLSLPCPISAGIYQPLAGCGDRALTDMVLWGLNLGRNYVVQPGCYAALTPSGVEFTVLTKFGEHTLVGTGIDAAADEDIVLEFVWDSDGIFSTGGNTIEMYGNGRLLAASRGRIAPQTLLGIYPSGADGAQNGQGQSQPQAPAATAQEESGSSDVEGDVDERSPNAQFWAMDAAGRENGLAGTLRRIEVFRRPDTNRLLSFMEGSTSSGLSTAGSSEMSSADASGASSASSSSSGSSESGGLFDIMFFNLADTFPTVSIGVTTANVNCNFPVYHPATLTISAPSNAEVYASTAVFVDDDLCINGEIVDERNPSYYFGPYNQCNPKHTFPAGTSFGTYPAGTITVRVKDNHSGEIKATGTIGVRPSDLAPRAMSARAAGSTASATMRASVPVEMSATAVRGAAVSVEEVRFMTVFPVELATQDTVDSTRLPDAGSGVDRSIPSDPLGLPPGFSTVRTRSQDG